MPLDRIGVPLLDAQVINPFTMQLGAVLVRRSDYLKLLRQALTVRTDFDGRRWPLDGLGDGAAPGQGSA